MIITLDAKRRVSIPAALAPANPGDQFEAPEPGLRVAGEAAFGQHGADFGFEEVDAAFGGVQAHAEKGSQGQLSHRATISSVAGRWW